MIQRRLDTVTLFVLLFAELALIAYQLGRRMVGQVGWIGMSVHIVVSSILVIAIVMLARYVIRRSMLRAYMSEVKALTIEDISTDAVFTMDLDLDIKSWSRGAERVFGYSEEEAIDQSASMLLPQDIPESDVEMLEQLKEEKIINQHRTMRRRKNGGVFPAETSISILYDEQGKETGGLVVLRDITHQVAIEEEIRRINRELEGFAQVVSHDLRAPLSRIKLASDTLSKLFKAGRENLSDEEMAELLRIIGTGVERSSQLIGDLLTLAEAGQEPKEVKSVDVSEVVDGILEERIGTIEEREITVEVDDALGVVNASPAHVYQLFSNLIGNAMKHNDSAEPMIRVGRIDVEGENRHGFLVRDNGSGIPEEDLERIFEPFFKGDRGDVGLGLSTVERIVGVYDGSIEAYNDGGACFEFAICDYDVVD